MPDPSLHPKRYSRLCPLAGSGEWLALDEQLRIHLAEKFHRKARVKLPNVRAHVIVENQIAIQHRAVVRAMERLAKQGLSRRDPGVRCTRTRPQIRGADPGHHRDRPR